MVFMVRPPTGRLACRLCVLLAGARRRRSSKINNNHPTNKKKHENSRKNGKKGMRHRAELGVLGNDDEVVETTSFCEAKKALELLKR